MCCYGLQAPESACHYQLHQVQQLTPESANLIRSYIPAGSMYLFECTSEQRFMCKYTKFKWIRANSFLESVVIITLNKFLVQFVDLKKTDILFTMQKDAETDLNVLFKIPSENQIEIAEWRVSFLSVNCKRITEHVQTKPPCRFYLYAWNIRFSSQVYLEYSCACAWQFVSPPPKSVSPPPGSSVWDVDMYK